MSVVVVGAGSLLAQAVARQPQAAGWTFLSHHQALLYDWTQVRWVVNFALDPLYFKREYDDSIDFDWMLANRVKDYDCRYLMCSSRKVYAADAGFSLAEDAPLRGQDTYGRNKVVSEDRLGALLGDRLAVIRISNVLGFNWDWQRVIFVALMLGSLRRENRIVFDLNPFTRKDFITDDAVARAVCGIVTRDVSGTYNIGSGIALPIGHLPLWTIEGYGRGELLVTSPQIRDEFVLDVKKASAALGVLCPLDELRHKCLKLGKDLGDA